MGKYKSPIDQLNDDMFEVQRATLSPSDEQPPHYFRHCCIHLLSKSMKEAITMSRKSSACNAPNSTDLNIAPGNVKGDVGGVVVAVGWRNDEGNVGGVVAVRNVEGDIGGDDVGPRNVEGNTSEAVANIAGNVANVVAPIGGDADVAPAVRLTPTLD
jgi:hypothetical protein